MKDSKLYAGRIKRQVRSLKRTGPKVQRVMVEDPLEALVYGLMSEPVTEAQAQAAQKRLTRHFVDLNDLRVAGPDEITGLFGDSSPAVREAAARVTQVLMAVFNRFHALSLAATKKMGKRPARQFLESLDGITPFAVDYCMLTSMHGHAIPLTERMVRCLKAEGLVHPQAEPGEIGGFLAKLVPAQDAYEFYAELRARSELRRPSEPRASSVRKKSQSEGKKAPSKKPDQP
ncbi:MAG: hypothetical protein KBE04_03490 [Phycisphaerae bacterium]|nr:hypothetical protein [Phycisphaerae bacterium]